MGLLETYRLNQAILSICSEEGRRIPVVVPSGATVTLPDGPLDGLRLVDVLWEGKQVMLFTVDLRERATLIQPPATKLHKYL
jgi:hypothetical protein